MNRRLQTVSFVSLVAVAGCGGTPENDPSRASDADGGVKAFECEDHSVQALGELFFTDVSLASGIQDENFAVDPPLQIPINDHSRLAFGDINGDGFDDIVMHSLFPNLESAGIPLEHLVFLNKGDGSFENFSDASGLREVQASFFAFADVDNDGDQDVFAGLDVPYGSLASSILLNDGDGHFSTLANSGVEGTAGNAVAGNAVFADFDGDGILDLFVGNGHTRFLSSDSLFMGKGDGTFENASARLLGRKASPTNGSTGCDFDNDGDVDILASVYGVSNGGAQNFLFQNDGTGNFNDVAAEKGFASLSSGNYFLASTGHGADDQPGGSEGTYIGGNSFGLACEDVNNDGYLDAFVTAISHPVDSDYNRKWSDPTTLLINQGPDGGYRFVNEFQSRGLPFNEGDVDGAAIDFDNDGRVDLSMSRERKYESNYTDDAQKGYFGLMRQKEDGRFEDLSMTSGINVRDDELAPWRMKGAQNHAWSDIDHDGDLDLLVGGRGTSNGRPNFLFRNEAGSKNPWLAIRVEGDGVHVNRDGIGTRVELVFADKTLTREVKMSRGMHNSMDTRTLHFGLGDYGCDFTVRVAWPDGTVNVLGSEDIHIGAYSTIRYQAAAGTQPQ